MTWRGRSALAWTAFAVGGSLGAAALTLSLWSHGRALPALALVIPGLAAYLLVLVRALTGRAADDTGPGADRPFVFWLALAGGVAASGGAGWAQPSGVLAALFVGAVFAVGLAASGGNEREAEPPWGLGALTLGLALAGSALALGAALPATARVGLAALVVFVAPGLAWAQVLHPEAAGLERALRAPVLSIGLVVPSVVWASALGWPVGRPAALAICLLLTGSGLGVARLARARTP